MATYSELTFKQNRRAERPSNFEGLLFHVIADDPYTEKSSYQNWQFDHAHKKRFYIAGAAWFMSTTGVNRVKLAELASSALKEVNNTGWKNLVNSGDAWGEVGRPQFQKMLTDAMLPQKCALVILACELYLAQELKKGREFLDVAAGGQKIANAEYIYRRMSIIPAVWNVDDLNKSFWTELSDDDRRRIANTSGQSASVIADLANGSKKEKTNGHTVTHSTAREVKKALDDVGKLVGNVRARPGKRLGQGGASEGEIIDKG